MGNSFGLGFVFSLDVEGYSFRQLLADLVVVVVLMVRRLAGFKRFAGFILIIMTIFRCKLILHGDALSLLNPSSRGFLSSFIRRDIILLCRRRLLRGSRLLWVRMHAYAMVDTGGILF